MSTNGDVLWVVDSVLEDILMSNVFGLQPGNQIGLGELLAWVDKLNILRIWQTYVYHTTSVGHHLDKQLTCKYTGNKNPKKTSKW